MPRIVAFKEGAKRINVTVNGVPLAAVEGETIAGMMAAQGNLVFHETRSGQASGPYCAMGTCFGCRVEVIRVGRPVLTVRACVTPVEDGMIIVAGRSLVEDMRVDA